MSALAAFLLFWGAGAWADRAFVTDRPSVADTALTMREGFWRLEVSLAAIERTGDGDDRADRRTYGSFYLVRGVGDSAELQFGIDGYQVLERPAYASDDIGTTELRMKFNLSGNDNEALTFAVMPGLQYEGPGRAGAGVVVPFGYRVTELLSLNSNFSYDFVGGDGSSTDETWRLGVAPTFAVNPRLNLFVQYGRTRENTTEAHLIGTGFSYLLDTRLQIDGEFNRGVISSDGDWESVFGLAFGF